MNGQTPLLEVQDLSVTFRMYDKALRQHDLQVISELSVTVNQGEILAIAGSSGSGKSLLAHAVLGLLPANATVSGRMLYQGQELTPPRQEQLRGSEIALTPQSVTYLDPLLRVGDQVRDGKKTAAAVTAQREAFQRYDLQPEIEAMFPFQLSGGMARRVLVSTAVLSGARLIVADEPTPGLGADIAQDMMNTFRELADSGKSVILITHDIELACAIADRVAIFYGGTTVEVAAAEDFAAEAALRHPYSKALYRALPQNGFRPLAGFQPYPGNLPAGCLFAARCGLKTPECNKKVPLRELRGGSVRCIHAT